MHGTYRFILITFWLFALTAPSVLTLLDPEGTKLVMNLNEEELEETTLTSFEEEQAVNANCFALFPPLVLGKISRCEIGPVIFLDCTLEILLPPPEALA
jgi:hypothetical protein